MTDLRHQVSDEWVERYDRGIRLGYVASQSCVVISLGAWIAGLLVTVPVGWMAWPMLGAAILAAAWMNASRYQMACIRRATAEVQDDIHRIDHETAEINAETRRVRQQTAEIEAGTVRVRGEQP